MQDYHPQAGSLASQVLAFFARCPDETLGLEEITTKFDAS